jgi:hypothetical protein
VLISQSFVIELKTLHSSGGGPDELEFGNGGKSDEFDDDGGRGGPAKAVPKMHKAMMNCFILEKFCCLLDQTK